MLLQVIFLCYLYSFVDASGCETFRGSPQTNHICDEFVGPTVYVPVNYTQEILDISVASKVRAAQAIAPLKCAKAAIELFCQTAFLACDSSLSFIPSFPCKAKCNLTLEECKPYAAEVGEIATIDCNMQNDQTMQDQWPDSVTMFNISGLILQSKCNAATFNVTSIPNPETCPYPMEIDAKHTDIQPPCRLKCPLPILREREYSQDRRISYTIASISIVFLVFLMGSFLLANRKYPFNLFIYLFLACIIVCIAVIVPTATGDKFVCHNGLPSTQKNYAPCAIQGAVLFFFGLAATFWWFVIILNLYLMVIGKLTKKGTGHVRALRFYHAFAWGLPLLLLIIALSASEFSFNAPNILCFLPLFGDDVWYQYSLFYIPIGIFTVAGAIFIILIMTRLVQSWISVEGKVEADARIRFAYYKISFFGIAILALWSSIFIGRMTIANDNAAEKSFTNWVGCQVNAYAVNQSYLTCGEVAPVRVSRRAMHAQYVAQTIHGIVLYLLFCRDRELYTCWYHFFIRLFSAAKNWWRQIRYGKEAKRTNIPLRMSSPVSESITSQPS